MRNYIFKLMAELECARYYLPYTCPLKKWQRPNFCIKRSIIDMILYIQYNYCCIIE